MEMIIVLGIIALLMGMVMLNLQPITGYARDQKVDADLLAFKEALAGYQLESGALPTTEQGLSVLWQKPTIDPIPDRWRPAMEQEVKDPWGHPYQFRNPGKHNPDRYDVFSMGPDGKPDTDDDIGNWKTSDASKSP